MAKKGEKATAGENPKTSNCFDDIPSDDLGSTDILASVAEFLKQNGAQLGFQTDPDDGSWSDPAHCKFQLKDAVYVISVKPLADIHTPYGRRRSFDEDHA